jgi:hypothetical protein
MARITRLYLGPFALRANGIAVSPALLLSSACAPPKLPLAKDIDYKDV